jgi:MFS family permease
MGTGATFLLLSLAGFAIGANLRVTDPLLPTFAIEFGTTVGAAAIVATVFSFAHGALQLVYGPLGDRLGKLRIVAYAAIASALISAATASRIRSHRSRRYGCSAASPRRQSSRSRLPSSATQPATMTVTPRLLGTRAQ